MLGKGLSNWIDRRVAATIALVQHHGLEAQAEMKSKAPWTDRTGNARAGLFASTMVETPDPGRRRITLCLGHGVVYGVFLERANAGRYAIVDPTADRLAPDLARRLQRLWGEAP